VLVLGGGNTEGLSLSAEAWDPASGSFSAAGSLTVGHDDPTTTLLPDGRALVVGGTAVDGEALNAAELFAPDAASE
jgi:hypothetical protein